VQDYEEFKWNNLLKIKFDIILDAIFGFSFKGDQIREPFNKIINDIKNIQS